MTWLVYDGSFEGLLSAIFDTYEYKWKRGRIRKEGSSVPQLFAEIHTVVTDESKASRVWKKMVSVFGADGVRTLWIAWLSELETIEDTILGVVNYALELKKNVLGDFGNLHVLQVQQTAKSVGREKHRMEAFVRFQLTKDELYFAVIDPDFNVLPLILKHFSDRYADQRWFIFDSRRQYGIYYDLTEAAFVDFLPGTLFASGQICSEALSDTELLYQHLWSDYFSSTNIAGRKNTKLHVQHVPKRYWKYLIEKRIVQRD